MGRTIHINESFAPLVLITMVSEPTDAEVDWYFAYIGEVHRRRQPFALVYDLTKTMSAKATHRKRKAEFLKEYAPLTRAHCAGVTFAVSSPLIRGLLTAIFWIQPMACPFEVFASVEQCMTWSHAQMATSRNQAAP